MNNNENKTVCFLQVFKYINDKTKGKLTSHVIQEIIYRANRLHLIETGIPMVEGEFDDDWCEGCGPVHIKLNKITEAIDNQKCAEEVFRNIENLSTLKYCNEISILDKVLSYYDVVINQVT